MDEEIQKKKESGTKGPIQMTAVVPIAGLIMARFHIYNNECQTICMMWGKDSKMKNKEPKKKGFSFFFLLSLLLLFLAT